MLSPDCRLNALRLLVVFGSVLTHWRMLPADDAVNLVFSTVESALENPDFLVQGEYSNDRVGLQVVALGNGQFTAVVYKGGLPGAGWDGTEPERLEEDAAGIEELTAALGVVKVERTSDTLGLAPPPGAIVLFDGTLETLQKHWQPGARMTDDGLLMEGCTGTDHFQDFTAHIEFRTPFMPAARDQGRGNSGVYYQARYETQVLDSFGLLGKNNEAGGLYSIRDPDLNMCLPPLAWQTYDVDYTAARWNDAGEKIANPRITVRLNGVVVHRDVELPGSTTAAPQGESREGGPLYLQDHGNPVRYRNIWVLPRDADREALRPIIPAWERFHSTADADQARGGQLLLGELACTKCHAAGESLSAGLLVKEPPILSNVGARVHPEWIVKYLVSHHEVKPGTTMPDVLGGMSPDERRSAAIALANFLSTTGSLPQAIPERDAAQRGEKLYHEVGCIQCHTPLDGRSLPSGTVISLQKIGEKYSVPSLSAFLKDPRHARPSGRMPGWRLDDRDITDIAAYLVGEVVLTPVNPNLTVAIYEGDWSALPKFDELTPTKVTEVAGLDVLVAGKSDHFALRFDGYLPIEQEGEYTFHLGSDDGSRLLIDGGVVVNNDGIHAHQESSGRVKLSAGVHAVRVEHFEAAGGESVKLEYEGPGISRQDAAPRLLMTPEGNPKPPEDQPVDPDVFVFDPAQVDKGRELFASLGCAGCHELRQGNDRMTSARPAPALAECRPEAGCLGESIATGVPNYHLSPLQRQSIVAAVTGAAANAEVATAPRDRVHQTLETFNCYACHSRDNVGGATRERNALFLSTIPEMGDEGRLPPPLDGVGDKLTDAALRDIISNGASDRPYLRTRMPRFGDSVAHLVVDFAALDRRDEATLADFDEPPHRTKASGRQLVGDQGLACIKCHTFGNRRATGIQAIDLHTMTRRLREDWFLRYLYDPNAYRPGTRMPTGFPEGVAVIKDVYGGDPQRQISAIWRYLEDGGKASIPDGLIADMIELKPEGRPILYRNFLEGLSPRGIAVGYPEGVHLAWDANRMCLAQVWHGRFIDASMHWNGRGPGFQSPLGDGVVRVETTTPVATLESADTPWPSKPPREAGYHFEGYRLDAAGRPTFRYDGPGFTVSDSPEPLPFGQSDLAGFNRRISLERTDSATTPIYFRAAAAGQIELQPDGSYLVGGALRVLLEGGGTPFLRESGGQRELLVPLEPGQTLTQSLRW